ncbi:hypothetical protein POM88_012865 [Heracleum sosnowskyi]|uniref:Uncharacterized protein n=1 Tax=Heracleum sosnowskyi TaxID=360622 RepID=A0AAD8IYY9_9APIA|nr:hypothetical protein POM88_012865 [Heracleum sosnowskyi]
MLKRMLSPKLIDLVFADGSGSGGPCLSVANGVWVDESLSLSESFKQVVDGLYKAVHVDFQTNVALLIAVLDLLIDLVFADGSGSGGPCLSFANGVWVDESLSLSESFKQVVDGLYKAVHVDFQTNVALLIAALDLVNCVFSAQSIYK